MIRRHLLGWLGLVLCLAVAGCDEGPTAPTSVVDVTWELVSIEQGLAPATVVATPGRYTLRLAADGAAIVGSDCNRCNGRYTMDGSAITLSALACTRAFCGNDSLDGPFGVALEQVRTIATSKDEMILRGPAISLSFRRQRG